MQATRSISHRDESWLAARSDRRELVEWLAAAASRQHNEFLTKSLTMLISTGSLSPTAETALRTVMLRAQRVAARDSPKLAPALIRARAAREIG